MKVLGHAIEDINVADIVVMELDFVKNTYIVREATQEDWDEEINK